MSGIRRGLGVAVQAGRRYVADGMPERAPSIAYYGILSLFPTLVLALAILRFVAGESAAEDIASYTREYGVSGAVRGSLRSAIATAQEASAATAGSAGLLSMLTLVYGASRAFTAAGRAIDAIDRRAPLPRSLARRAEDIGWTLALLLLGLVMLVLATLSGRVLDDLLDLLGISGIAATFWAVARWPLAAAVSLLLVSLVRWAAPTAGKGRFRFISPGRLVTVGALVTATAGYNVYVAEFASYNDTYGAFAAAIILMLWIWLAGSVLLYGTELDAVLEQRDQPLTSPTWRARETASERDEASSLR